MARPPINRKTGAMTATERQQRWRVKVRNPPMGTVLL
jgi:hypothetical protein